MNTSRSSWPWVGNIYIKYSEATRPITITGIHLVLVLIKCVFWDVLFCVSAPSASPSWCDVINIIPIPIIHCSPTIRKCAITITNTQGVITIPCNTDQKIQSLPTKISTIFNFFEKNKFCGFKFLKLLILTERKFWHRIWFCEVL